MRYYAGIGSRKTPKDICDQMAVIARELSEHFVLRSGAAGGADIAFERGCRGEKEIYLPWFLFNNRTEGNGVYVTPKLPNYSEAKKIASIFHPNWINLSHAAKKFHTRNVYQILGLDLNTPAEFVVCWTENGGISGGTGQAMRIAKHKHIPIINLKKHAFNLRDVI